MVVLTAIVLVLSTVSVSVAAEVLQGAAQGYGGTVAVKVSFENGVIAGVEVDAPKETQDIGSRAAEELPARIVESGSAEVDGVSGATVTSDAIKAAVRDCLTAANTAIDAGKSVILVEKAGITGGSTVTSGGNIFGAATTAQKASGVTDDTPEALYDFLMSFDEDGLLNADMVKDYAFGIADDLDYLDANGVDVTFITTAAEPLKPNRLHLTSEVNAITNGIGGGITVPLTEKIVEKGGKILFATKATEILMDENGKATGIQAVDCNGEAVKVNAGAVILTTGGYCMNPDLTARFKYFNPYFSAAITSTGDGLLMAKGVGAKVFESDGLQLQYVDFTTGETGSTSFGLVVDIVG